MKTKLMLLAGHKTQPKGTALIVALAIVIMLASLSVVMLNEMTSRSRYVEVELEDIKAFEAAEAGLDAAIRHINQSPVEQLRIGGVLQFSPEGKPIATHKASEFPGCLGTTAWTNASDTDGNGRPSWRADTTATAGTAASTGAGTHEDNIVPQSLGDVAFFTYAIDWVRDGIDNNGVGGIDDVTERNKYTIYSTGIHKGVVKSGITDAGKVVTVEAIVEAIDVDGAPLPPAAIRENLQPK